MTQLMREWIGSRHLPTLKTKTILPHILLVPQTMICCSIVCKEARTLKPNSLCLWYSFFSPNISHSLKQISHHQRALLLLKYKSPKHPHFSNYFNSLKFSFTLREKKKNHRLCKCRKGQNGHGRIKHKYNWRPRGRDGAEAIL